MPDPKCISLAGLDRAIFIHLLVKDVSSQLELDVPGVLLGVHGDHVLCPVRVAVGAVAAHAETREVAAAALHGDLERSMSLSIGNIIIGCNNVHGCNLTALRKK